MMLMDSFGSKKSSKNKKRSKSTQAERGMAEKKAKETTPKVTCFYCGQVGQCKRNCKAYLELKKNTIIFRSLCHMAHTYGLICRA